MKKLLFALLAFALFLTLTGCAKKEKLYILNVGDYINDELVSKFEKQYNCKVIYTEVNSNEEIYQKLKNDDYDICVVSDYMIDRMMQEGIAKKIDFTRLENYKFDDLFDDAKTLINNQAKTYKDYFIPYFWGTVGILYNTDKEGVEEYVTEKGLAALYEQSEYNIGMYDSSRDAICMGLIGAGITDDINIFDEAKLREATQALKNVTYRAWGDDNLKTMVHSGMLDFAMVYSGDYLDEAYQCEVDGEEVNFGYFAPDHTNIWIDGMVLTSKTQNEDLAYKFFDFIEDFDNHVENADYIGYSPLNEKVFYELFGEDITEEDFDLYYPYKETRTMYRYVSTEHYNLLNDLLEESKSK